MSSPRLASLLTLALLGLATPAAFGQDSVRPGDEVAPALREANRAQPKTTFSVAGWGTYQFDTDYDNGPGDVNITRIGAQVGMRTQFSSSTRLLLGFQVGLDEYDWSGPSLFTGFADPWDDIESMGFSATIDFDITNKWSLFGGPIFRVARESGADFDDSWVGGGKVGARYKAKDGLTYGFGIGAVDRLQDSVQFFPVFILDWEIADGYKLTSRPFGGGGGMGALELVYTVSPTWQLGFGGGYRQDYFRLDDDGVAPDGVGRDEGFMLAGRVTWLPTSQSTVSLRCGMSFGQEFRLERANGSEIGNPDMDPGFVIGLSGSIRF